MTAYTPGDLPKRCGCGEVYDVGRWERLRLLGHQGHLPGPDDVLVLELRNCEVCHSTLAVEVVWPRRAASSDVSAVPF